MTAVYIIEGNFRGDRWIKEVFDSLKKATTYLNKNYTRSGSSENPFHETWEDGLDWFMIRKKEVK